VSVPSDKLVGEKSRYESANDDVFGVIVCRVMSCEPLEMSSLDTKSGRRSRLVAALASASSSVQEVVLIIDQLM
jgi:hypothetical protein